MGPIFQKNKAMVRRGLFWILNAWGERKRLSGDCCYGAIGKEDPRQSIPKEENGIHGRRKGTARNQVTAVDLDDGLWEGMKKMAILCCQKRPALGKVSRSSVGYQRKEEGTVFESLT